MGVPAWSAQPMGSISYLDRVAATPAGRAYKRRLLASLELCPGHVVADVGCGPGTDLADLAAAVTGAGLVIGVDRDPLMVAEARRRMSDRAHVAVRAGDAHDLPLLDASVDRAREDRVLQHLADPARAMAELRRVLRPRGRVALAEPDWNTLVIDSEDGDGFARFLGERVRNPAIGRRLGRLLAGAGFAGVRVEAAAILLDDLDIAEQVLGLHRNTRRAVRAGVLDERAADRLAAGPFLACFTLFTATATVMPMS